MESANENLIFSYTFIYNFANLATSEQGCQGVTKATLFYDTKGPKKT